MTSFQSRITGVGWVKLPEFTGVRVMMMPFYPNNPRGSLPELLEQYRDAIAYICGAMIDEGDLDGDTGYLTIDESVVKPGETHRRPGLHVDGVGPDGRAGGWGGGGGYGKSGMLTVSSHVGCRGYNQMFEGWPGPDGDCAHLADQCTIARSFDMLPERVYHCEPLAVHESLPHRFEVKRQFVRISLPSDAPWYEGYTENPLGIPPAGPIHPRRVKQMEHRS